MSPLLISLAAFIGVTALVGAVAMLFRGDGATAVEDRLAMLTGNNTGRIGKEKAQQSVLAQPLFVRPNVLEALVSRFNLPLLFEQADTNLTVQKFLAISLLVGAGGAAVASAGQLHLGLVA